MNILITGANGFVGQALCDHLMTQTDGKLTPLRVFAAVRSPLALGQLPQGIHPVPINTLADLNQDSALLAQLDVVVHLAARVHQMKDTAVDPLAAFREVNTLAPCALAYAAANHGVKRFIYLSSIKVNGEQTPPGLPFTPNDDLHPQGAYAQSKYEAELELKQIARETGLELVIIRPPLVYGPGVKANFLTLMQWLARGYPLPLGAIHNRRSLVALPNLVDLITHCLTHPAAANQTFLVSDNEDLSTTDLLKRLAYALDRPARLLPIPRGVLQLAAQLLGKPSLAQRLCASLQVDMGKTQALLGWSPPVSVGQALQLTALSFLQGQNKSDRANVPFP